MENAFIHESYKEMVARNEAINNTINEKTKAIKHSVLFGSDEEIQKLVNAYNKRSNKYYVDLSEFMFICFKFQSFEIMDGLAIDKKVLSDKE
ncbi:hypothetical protein [Chryseobacterium gambrini]|uniref:hypothetical protein n=1 Tax=Chryseobacterium gambrini TaxID=373672 RepID=UPI0025B4BE6D|nr:hypothetical protein [Chryseobacterium gambrini]MDN4029811.1 hypothetical protein [Chryseobacterium gambrini]